MSLKKLLFVTFSILLFQQTYSQRNFEEYNHLGIQGGLVLFDINTSDFITQQGEGFMGGFTTRGAFRNGFDLIYGISFYNSKVSIQGKRPGGLGDATFMGYTIQAAQLNFLGSYNIVKHHLSIEFGPILNVNGKLKLDSDQFENYIVDGYTTLRAGDIEDISKINFRVMGGITAGLENFRLSASYQYGLTNMLKNLNDKELEYSDFDGKSSTITLAAVIYF
ncbi:PorT family protein [Constantimarinum furrinae]|uniref:Outer membrane protein beta-barrel domain-containing protein n=1 Tax=Constantimarinum furrinae TaxID=2562285 RepID=A0A7G8PT33_9FLAO|nr:PorT family protein [Constantimarinum furrinae]QNJ97499.1 hypothetical protein ALE3EI_0924 [Constantimarinum furrinae]